MQEPNFKADVEGRYDIAWGNLTQKHKNYF